MGKELTPEQIKEIIQGTGRRKKKDTSEPRTFENWWPQIHHILRRDEYPDLDLKCANPNCGDPRPNDSVIILGEIKGVLMCRYCFLSGYLSE